MDFSARDWVIRACLLACACWSTSGAAQSTEPPTQSDHRTIGKDLVAMGAYKWLAPAEATGLTGFGMGVFGSYLPVGDKGAYERYAYQEIDELGVAGVSLQKGLPYGFDVGVEYAYLPRKGTSELGGQVQYAIWQGGVASPALAIRGGYTHLTNVEHPAVITYNFDLAVSKGFGNLTPYGSIGYLHGRFDTYDVEPVFHTEKIGLLRLIVGLRATLGLVEITPEYSLAGSSSVFNLRFGFSI